MGSCDKCRTRTTSFDVRCKTRPAVIPISEATPKKMKIDYIEISSSIMAPRKTNVQTD